MALTIANTHSQFPVVPVGNGAIAKVQTVTFDSSYATGGESLTPSNVGMSEFLAVIPLPDANALEGHVVQYDYTAQKLMVFRQTDPADAGGADVALVEVANAVDLSTLVVRVVCLGA